MVVLVSCCCYKKLPKIQQLTTTQVYYYRFGDQTSENRANQGVAKPVFLLKALGENLLLALSSFQRLCAFLVSWPPSSNGITSTFASIVTFPVTLIILPPSFKDPCEYIGPTHIIQDDLPISRSSVSSHLQSPSCHVREHIHRCQGLGCGHLWGIVVLPATVMMMILMQMMRNSSCYCLYFICSPNSSILSKKTSYSIPKHVRRARLAQ